MGSSESDALDQQVADVVSEESVSATRSEQYRLLFEESVVAPLEIIWEDWRTRFGVIILAAIVFMGTVGVALTREPVWNEAEPYIGPFDASYTTHYFGLPDISFGAWTYTGLWTYPLGTDGVGKAIFRGLVHATPAMIKMMLAGAVLAMALATVIGITAGYVGGLMDDALMFVTDIVLTIPGLPLILIIASVYPPESAYLVGFLLAIDNWPGLARTLRSQVLAIRNESYVEASQAMGLSRARILRKDIGAQLMPYVTINAATSARGIIFESVGLYFLGILPFNEANWGVMMNEAYQTSGVLSNMSRIHWLIMPMLAIFVLSVALILLSQGMDRLFNPRIRARHTNTDGATVAPDDAD